MHSLKQLLQDEYGDLLTFEDEKVEWDKQLLLTLRDLGFELKVEDHATKVVLVDACDCIHPIPYEVRTVSLDGEPENDYEILLLDFQNVPIE